MNTRTDRFSEKMQTIPPSAIRKFFDLCIGHDVNQPDEHLHSS